MKKDKEQTDLLEEEQQVTEAAEGNYVTLAGENERLQAEVNDLKKQIEAIKEQQKKLMLATKVNTLKEQEIRTEEYKKYAKQKLIEDTIMPVLLNFERALGFKTESEDVKRFLVGFKFIFNEFKNSLEKEGLTVIKVKTGEIFDSHICEVLETEEIEKETKDQKDNMIIKVIEHGYKLHDRVISHAKVKILKVKNSETENLNKGE